MRTAAGIYREEIGMYCSCSFSLCLNPLLPQLKPPLSLILLHTHHITADGNTANTPLTRWRLMTMDVFNANFIYTMLYKSIFHLSLSTVKHLLLMLAVVPVMSLVLAGQEVGPVVPLALHEFHEVMSTVVPLLQRQLGQVHLLLSRYHLCRRDKTISVIFKC